MCIKTTDKYFTYVNTGDFIDMESTFAFKHCVSPVCGLNVTRPVTDFLSRFVARTLVRWHVDDHWNKVVHGVVWPQMWTSTGSLTTD
jgi:hypothetical protein